MEKEIILEARNITKVFPGVIAVNNVTIQIYKGEVCALVGENGAGKSTLVKILAGVYSDYDGQIVLEGQEVRFKTPREALENGIVLIPQELDLVPNLSIAENIFLSREPVNEFGVINYQEMFEKTSQLLSKLGVKIDPRTKVEDLSTSQQQMVAIAKALSFNARIIIMDEPTSAIGKQEVELLFDIIKTLKKEGKSIIYISHRLEEIFEIADRVIVMRDGQKVGEGPIRDFNQDKLIRLMVGRSIEQFFVKTRSIVGDEVLKVENIKLWSHDRRKLLVDGVSFYVRKGEVLGIYGLVGAGRTELLEAIFGMHPKRTEGRIFIEGKEVKISSPKDAIRNGMGFVPEDRKMAGLILQLPVLYNISLTLIILKLITKFGLINRNLEMKVGHSLFERLNIRATSPFQITEELSGGNQQKVVIAKWLAIKPKVLLLDEPTRGIDVNAKVEIYKLINEMTALGMGVVMVSSELPEILAMSDRIIVISEGRKAGEFSREEVSEEDLLRRALPGSTYRG